MAAAERGIGRDVRVDALIQEDFDAVQAMAERSGIALRRLGLARLLTDMVLMRAPGRRPRAVHLHSGMDLLSGRIGMIRCVLPRSVPLIVWLHGSGELANAEPAQRREHAVVAARVSAIVVPSESRRDAQLAVGVSPSSVHVIPAIVPAPDAPPGAARRRLGIGDQTRIVLFCGRLIESKNPLLAIDAFRACADKRSVLVIAGDGPLMPACRAAAGDLGDRVRILGHVNDMDELFADADVFISPSANESFGLTVIEALQSNVACALSRIRPWSDYLTEGEDVDYFPPSARAGQVAGVLDRLLASDELRARRAAHGRRTVRSLFSPEAALTALEDVYRHIGRPRSHT
jgi:glycosyltransferase involved in cell wall biosynthesis